MIRNPIYRPKGKAAEYADYALNIYIGCTNGCTYCYAPKVLRKSREEFTKVVPREGLIEALHKQLKSGAYKGKTIHLCFTCDPYPHEIDTRPTRRVIKELKAAGCHVQILTKNPSASSRDWDLLDGDDWIGTTITGADPWNELQVRQMSEMNHTWCAIEPHAERDMERFFALKTAKTKGFHTWVSCEPIFNPNRIYYVIQEGCFIDLFKFGKLNYQENPGIDYAGLRGNIERLCQAYNRNYLIKESLRGEME